MPENGRRRRLRKRNLSLTELDRHLGGTDITLAHFMRRNTARLIRIDRILDATDERLERLAEEAGLTSLLLEDHKEHGGHLTT